MQHQDYNSTVLCDTHTALIAIERGFIAQMLLKKTSITSQSYCANFHLFMDENTYNDKGHVAKS